MLERNAPFDCRPAYHWDPGYTERALRLPPAVGHVRSHELQDREGSSERGVGMSGDNLGNWSKTYHTKLSTYNSTIQECDVSQEQTQHQTKECWTTIEIMNTQR